jgi:Tol biopolymer transport system component
MIWLDSADILYSVHDDKKQGVKHQTELHGDPLMKLRHSITSLALASTVVLAVLLTPLASPAASAQALIAGSPSDGLVFSVPSEAGMHMWRARIADGALQKLSGVEKREERWPQWSQDAQRLAFIERNTEGVMRANIRLLDVTTGAETGLGPNPDFIQRSPTWSSDGKSIAYIFRMPSNDSEAGTEAGIAVYDLDKNARQIIAKIEQTQQRMWTVSYAMNGQSLIAHGQNPKNASDQKLWLLNPKAGPSPLAKARHGFYGSPRFTRDGSQIVYDYKPSKTRARTVMVLGLSKDSGAPGRVSNKPRADEYAAMPSPTRDELVYLSNRDGAPALFLANLSGGAPVKLSNHPDTAASSAFWSPDGEKIAYVAVPADKLNATENKHEGSKVRVIDRTGKLLFETAGVMPNWMPAWTGDQPVAALAKNESPAMQATAK